MSHQLSLASLVLLCFCCWSCVLLQTCWGVLLWHLSLAFRSPVQRCHPKFCPFAGGHCPHQLGKMFFPVLGDAGPLLGSPDAAGPFWGGRTGPSIHLAAVFGAVRGGWGREEERGGNSQCQTETLGTFFRILICLGDTPTTPSRDLVKFLCSFVPGVRWNSLMEGRWSWEIPPGTSGLAAQGESQGDSRFAQLHCSSLWTLCFGARRPESWGFVCKLKYQWESLSAGIVPVQQKLAQSWDSNVRMFRMFWWNIWHFFRKRRQIEGGWKSPIHLAGACKCEWSSKGGRKYVQFYEKCFSLSHLGPPQSSIICFGI